MTIKDKLQKRIPKWLAVTFLIFGILFLLGGITGEVDMLIIGTILTVLAILRLKSNKKIIMMHPKKAIPTSAVAQQSVKQPPDSPSKKRRSPLAIMRDILIVIVLLPIVILMIAVGSASNNDDSNQTQSTQEAADQQEDEAAAKELTKTLVEDYVPAYCQSHQQKQIPLPYTEGDTWKYNTENPTVGVSEQDCRNVITYLVDNVESSAPTLEKISRAEISIGMNRHELLMSWGVPNDVNSTTVSGGTSAQWVYGDPIYGANYVYLDNDVITAIQNN